MKEHLRRIMLLSRGDLAVFVEHPVSAGFLDATALLLASTGYATIAGAAPPPWRCSASGPILLRTNGGNMDLLIVPLIAWVEAHAAWAPAIVFAIAFIESVPLIGLFMPGSALLLGIGLLIGSGVLSPGPVLVATFAGAVLGDAIGFWLCRWLGPAFVRRHLPRKYRRMYARGVLAFRRWGVWAVFIARFVSPLRAVAPIIAGVTRMRQWHFQLANISSAVIWAPLLLVPGTAAGWIAAVLGDRGDPVVLAVLVLGALLGAGLWLARGTRAGRASARQS